MPLSQGCLIQSEIDEFRGEIESERHGDEGRVVLWGLGSAKYLHLQQAPEKDESDGLAEAFVEQEQQHEVERERQVVDDVEHLLIKVLLRPNSELRVIELPKHVHDPDAVRRAGEYDEGETHEADQLSDAFLTARIESLSLRQPLSAQGLVSSQLVLQCALDRQRSKSSGHDKRQHNVKEDVDVTHKHSGAIELQVGHANFDPANILHDSHR